MTVMSEPWKPLQAQLSINPDPWFHNREPVHPGESLHFDGYSTWFYGNPAGLKQAESFSLLFDVAPAGFSSRGDGLFSCFDSIRNIGLSLTIRSDGSLEVWIGLGRGNVSFTSLEHRLARGAWNRVALVYRCEEGWCDLFLNGRLVNRGQFRRHHRLQWPARELYLGKLVDFGRAEPIPGFPGHESSPAPLPKPETMRWDSMQPGFRGDGEDSAQKQQGAANGTDAIIRLFEAEMASGKASSGNAMPLGAGVPMGCFWGQMRCAYYACTAVKAGEIRPAISDAPAPAASGDSGSDTYVPAASAAPGSHTSVSAASGGSGSDTYVPAASAAPGSYVPVSAASGEAAPLLCRDYYRNDPDRPRYHVSPPGRWMNEPHGPFFLNGAYHLFYQANPHGPVWDHIQWGHWTSTDMVHWRDLPLALETEPGKYDETGCWSGSSVVDKDGIPRIYYTAGDNRRFPNQAVAMAKAADPAGDPDLIRWEKHPQLIKEQDTGWLGEFRDPFVWLENDEYFMLVGTGDENNGGGNAALYSSRDGISWESHGFLVDYDFSINREVGHVWELPVLLPLNNPDGDVVCHILLLCACQIDSDRVETYYFLGNWNAAARKFTLLDEGLGGGPKVQLLDLGYTGFTGPSGFVTPDGRSVVFTIAQGKRSFSDEYHAGWAHNGGLPVSLWWDGGLCFEPIRELADCRKQCLLSLKDETAEKAGEALRTIRGNMLYVRLRICPVKSPRHSRMTGHTIFPQAQKVLPPGEVPRRILPGIRRPLP